MRSSSYQDRDGADHTALNADQAQIRPFPTAFNFPPATKSRGRKSNRLSPRLVASLLPSVTTTFTTLTLGEKKSKKCHKNSSEYA